MKITNEIFEKIENLKVFAVGIMPNHPDGLFMTRDYPGRLILWVAAKGGDESWAVYCGWLDNNTIQAIQHHGDKVYTNDYILRCVDCSDDVLKKYRR